MIDIKKILSEKENQFIEAKLADSKVPMSIWGTYSAFANTFGGTIILGLKIITFFKSNITIITRNITRKNTIKTII